MHSLRTDVGVSESVGRPFPKYPAPHSRSGNRLDPVSLGYKQINESQQEHLWSYHSRVKVYPEYCCLYKPSKLLLGTREDHRLEQRYLRRVYGILL